MDWKKLKEDAYFIALGFTSLLTFLTVMFALVIALSLAVDWTASPEFWNAISWFCQAVFLFTALYVILRIFRDMGHTTYEVFEKENPRGIEYEED